MELKQLTMQDCEPLLKFEVENRSWFEQFIPPRPTGYFSEAGLQQAVSELVKEQQENECYMCVIYDGIEIVGRANLNTIAGNEAELGYRVAEKAIGKGVATKAVSELLCIAGERLGLSLIKARTTRDNQASQAVLLKLGFKQTHEEKAAAKLNGKVLDFLYFEHRLA